eukprot:gene22818-31115_t
MELVARGLEGRIVAVNCAVEESTIGGRRLKRLPQDEFVRDNSKPDDIFVISLGGNDIALRPTCCTTLNMVSLLCCSTTSCIEKVWKKCQCLTPDLLDYEWSRYSLGSTVSSKDYCNCDAVTGLGPSCWSNCLSFPPGLGFFLHLFKDRVADIARRPGGSWAENTLKWLGYNHNPGHLQSVMKRVFELGTRQVRSPYLARMWWRSHCLKHWMAVIRGTTLREWSPVQSVDRRWPGSS